MAGKKGKSGRKPRVQLHAAATIPLATVDDHTPPEWLGEIGRTKFMELVAAIRKDGHVCLTSCDLDAISSYAEAWQDFFDAQRSIDENGAELWGFDQNGNRSARANPAVSRKNRAATRIRHGMARFGLSPGDRSSLRVQPVDRRPDGFRTFIGGSGASG